VWLGQEEISVRLKIVQAGDPALRDGAQPLSLEEIASGEIQQLISFMKETMRDAPGVGLAAPQVGLSIQLAVIEDRQDYLKDIPPEQLAERERRPVSLHVLINPKITLASEETVDFFEGCLSLAGFSAVVPRARHVRVECLDERGQTKIIEASGWYARILQHEIDHLHGTLYFDRMRSRTFTSLSNFSRFWQGKSITEVRDKLG
jgi:peptide deformylase